MEQADPMDEALALWPRLASRAGLPPDPPPAGPVLSRAGAGGRAIVLALGGDLVLKRGPASDRGAEGPFAARIAAQALAGKRLAGNTHGLSVPALLALLPDEGAALLSRLPGQTAAACLEQADSNRDRRAVLEDCGRWLAEFHRSGKTRDRPFQCRFALGQLARLRDRVLAGTQRIAEPGFFLRLCAAVEAAAPLFEGQPARHGRIHGDYGLDNILIDAGRVGVTGFRPARAGVVGHDVARLLVDFAAGHAEHRKIPEGELLQGPYRAAFFRGYDFAPRGDASIGFLTLVRLPLDWAAVPVDDGRRGLDAVVRLEGLRQTAFRLFPALRRA